MTNEEAGKTISKMLSVTDLTARANMTAQMIEACHMAIKALKQMDAIDEIRAEIKEVYKQEEPIDHDWAKGLKYSLKIIDKYKTGSSV